MIVFIEGPRHCGKTYLINKFMEQCTDPRVEYYKFYFADHLKTLKLEWQEDQPGMHYFSLGNIMTIMEMNLRPEYKDKIWIFDRAIISAYTWALLRKRLDIVRVRQEMADLLESDLFQNCKTIFIYPREDNSDLQRVKDHWDGMVKSEDEVNIMTDLIQERVYDLANTSRNNSLHFCRNDFDEAAVNSFIQTCNEAIGLNK